jgi:hypothetical protein
LPSDKQEEVLRKLVQSVQVSECAQHHGIFEQQSLNKWWTQINYKPLQPGDVQYIQASLAVHKAWLYKFGLTFGSDTFYRHPQRKASASGFCQQTWRGWMKT